MLCFLFNTQLAYFGGGLIGGSSGVGGGLIGGSSVQCFSRFWAVELLVQNFAASIDSSSILGKRWEERWREGEKGERKGEIWR